jgi:hypothetical protein
VRDTPELQTKPENNSSSTTIIIHGIHQDGAESYRAASIFLAAASPWLCAMSCMLLIVST